MEYILMAALLFCIPCSAETRNYVAATPQDRTAAIQTTNASAVLQGKISDSSGAVLPGATVTVTDPAGDRHTVITDGEGQFVLSGLAAGTYAITVTSPNFEDQKTLGFTVAPGNSNVFETQMRPAGESTNVQVAAESNTQVETEKSELAGTISQKEVVKFGLNGRNFSQLLTLAPGVSNQTQQDEAKVGVVGSAKFSVNGGRVEYNTFDVDGSDVLNTSIAASRGRPTLSVYPSLDAIAEIKVLTSNYGAQYGRSASGTILVTTKSGGQTFHGNAYEFLRNERFNARGFKDPPGPAPLYRRNDFGFTLGGPVYIPHLYNSNKDKTFFFFSEEFRLEQSPSSFSQAVPSLHEREGNFSDVCSGNSTTPDCPHISGINSTTIPIDQNASAILHTNVIPLANSSSGCTYSLTVAPTNDPATWPCYNITVSPSTYWREELFHIDHNLNPSTKISFRYIHDSWDTTTTAPQWQYNGVTNSFPTVLNRFFGPGLSLVGHLTTIAAASLVNDYSVSYVTQRVTLSTVNGPGASLVRPARLDQSCGALISSCGMGYIFPNVAGKIPGINIGGANASYGGSGFIADTSYQPWRNADPTISIRDDLSKAIGRHLIQAGVLFVDAQQSETSSATGANTGDVQGLLNYSNIVTSNRNTTGNAFADFLIAGNGADNTNHLVGPENAQGKIISYQQDSSQQLYANRYEFIEPYLEDNWKIIPRLTLNLGMRFSLFGNWTPNGSSVYNFVPEKFDRSLASTLQVDPTYGYVKDMNTGKPVLANAVNPAPNTINGLVQCGTSGSPASCMTSHYFNPSPRVGFAFDPTGGGTTSVRAGYGVFFEHGTGDEANTGSLTGSVPLVQSMTENAPLGNSFRLECIDGRGPGCTASPSVPAGAAFPLDVSAIPTKAVWPYVQQWSFSVQQQISKSTLASLAYVGSKGTHLAAVRQINQYDPVPPGNNHFGEHEPIHQTVSKTVDGVVIPGDFGECDPSNPFVTQNGYRYYPGNPAYINLEIACTVGVNPNSSRKYPGYGRILSVENIANSGYHSLQFTMRHIRGPLNLGISYSYSHSIDEASDRFASSVGNSLDPHTSRASSDFDERHILNISYVYQLHLDRILQFIGDDGACIDPVDKACRDLHPWGGAHLPVFAMKSLTGWELSGLAIHQSGTPFTVVNGGSALVSALDNAGVANGLGASSYPDVVRSPFCTSRSSKSTTSQVIGPLLGNRCQFVAPRGLTFGNAGRNFMNNPARTNFDVALARRFSLPHETQLEVRAEAFNVLNHVQYRIYNPEKGNTSSNTITCYGDNANSLATSPYSAGASSCDPGNAFLRPVDAHRPRTVQLGVKMEF